jgi:hypothetical protein
MMRRILLASVLLISGPALAEPAPFKPSTDPNPVVRIDGDTLSYIGGINATGLAALTEVVRTLPDGQVTKMVINSGGGDTKAGIRIGSIVHDIKPELIIETGCFSSCANFIAPAARSITIRENAFLGWHGNDRGFEIVADQKGLTLREHMRTFAPKGDTGIDVEAWLDEVVPTLEALVAEEAELYARIGMTNDMFAVCGVGDRFKDRLTGGQLGGGFSIADMARLGLPPVRYEGKGAYEENPGFRQWLIHLTPEDCLP